MSGSFLLVVLALVIGWPLATLTRAEASRSGKAGLAFLLGIGAIALVLFAYSLAGISWSRLTILAAVVSIGAAGFAARRLAPRGGVPPPERPSRGGAVLLALAAVLVAGHLAFALSGPRTEADFLEIWGLKGRAFYEVRGVDWHLLRQEMTWHNHADYPPLLPLLFAGAGVLGGGWEDRELGALYTAFGAALLLIAEAALRKRFGRDWLTALAVLVLTPLALTPWIGIGEGPLLAFASAAMLYLAAGVREDDPRAITTGAVLLGLAALTKNEGILMVPVAAVAVFLAPGARLRVLRLWPAIALALVWIVPRAVLQLKIDLTAGDPLRRAFARLADPLPLLELLVTHAALRPVFWVALALGALAGATRLFRSERILTAFVMMQTLTYVGAFLVTPHELTWHVPWAWDRLLHHVLFLAAAAVLMALIGVIRSSDDASEAPETPRPA